MATDPGEAERRAAALEALRTAPPPAEAHSFWQQRGGKVVLAVAILLGFWLAMRAVGRFMRNSVAETARAEEELRRGLKR